MILEVGPYMFGGKGSKTSVSIKVVISLPVNIMFIMKGDESPVSNAPATAMNKHFFPISIF
jgi:hypothetical protein